jgi:hypothetical protein
MAFQVSPGVQVNEVDLTNVVPAVSTSTGAIAGAFRWGPVDQVVRVSSEGELINRFFEPDNTTFNTFLSAGQFLRYSNDLRVVRTANDGQQNASQSSGVLVKNEDDYESQSFSAGINYIAKYPGEAGNSLEVVVVTNETAYNDSSFTDEGYDRLFTSNPGYPGTTEYAEERGVTGDELHIVIIDKDGKIGGTPDTVLEIFEGVSQASDAKSVDGSSNYYVDVVNRRSEYVWVGQEDSSLPESGVRTSDTSNLVATSDGFEYTTVDTPIFYDFDDGSDGTSAEPSTGELQQAYDLYRNDESIDISIIIGPSVGSADDSTIANFIIGIAEERKDVIATVSPAVSRTLGTSGIADDVISWANGINSSSFGVLDSSALYVFDKFNDKFRYITAASTVAGLMANTDEVADPWFSPAGLNRGQLRNVAKLAFNPNKSERDSLYQARVNPLVSFPGEGTVMFGDRTALVRPSAFDRINVRRLFITLEKAISIASRSQLFELNDQFTRAQFRNLVEPFLRDVQGRRGITDFNVVCDDTNNTPEVIDSNRFVADIFIKPSRSINFIQLNFIAVRTGVEFSEIAG